MDSPSTTPGSVLGSDEVNVSGYLGVLRAKRAPILTVAFALAVVGGLVTFIMPAQYQVQAKLLLVVPDGADAIKAVSLAGQGPDALSILSAVLQSRPSYEYLADQTHLDPKTIDKVFNVDTDKPSNTVTLTAIGDPKLGMKVVSASIDKLSDLARTLQFSEGTRQATYLETTIKKKEAQLNAAEERLAEFQTKATTAFDPTNPTTAVAYTKNLTDLEFQHGTVVRQLAEAHRQAKLAAGPAMTIPTALPASADWRGKLVDLQYQLRVAQTKFGPEANEVIQLQEAIKVTKAQLQREIANYLRSVNLKVDANVAQLEAQRVVLEWQIAYAKVLALRAPQEAMKAEQLMLEISAQTDVLKDMRTQYEVALARAQVEKVKWSVLEKPWVSDDPTNKKYVRNCLIAFLTGGLVSWVWAIRKAR